MGAIARLSDNKKWDESTKAIVSRAEWLANSGMEDEAAILLLPIMRLAHPSDTFLSQEIEFQEEGRYDELAAIDIALHLMTTGDYLQDCRQ